MFALIMGAFWICGIGLSAFVATQACLHLTVDQAKGITATWRYPHKVVRKEIRATSVGEAAVISSPDSEGSPYYRARVVLHDGEFVDIAEGHNRSGCERACKRFNLALQQVNG